MRSGSGSGLTRCGVAGPSGSGLDRVTLRGDKKRCLSIHIPRGDAASARYLAREIFEYECYAAQGLEVTKGDTVVDVGANIGLFSIWASDLGARVLAFEPQQLGKARLELAVRCEPLGEPLGQPCRLGRPGGALPCAA